MNWNKKVDGVKLSELFESGRGRRTLDFRRKNREYIEVVRKKAFPSLPIQELLSDL